MAPVHRIEPDEDSDDVAMEAAVAMTEPLSTRAANQPRGLLKETPITLQSHHFGLPQTKTVVLTQTSYLSAIAPETTNDTTEFKMRLNTPVDWFITTGFTTPASGAAYDPGLFTVIMPVKNTAVWPVTASQVDFPNDLSNNESPQWRTFWEKQYQYYTVLGLEYELTFQNPQVNASCDIVVATYQDSYSANNATNIHPPGVAMGYMEQWPDVKFRRVASASENRAQAFETIKGFYRPGQNKNPVENDEDIKTWTKVGSLPSLTETMTVALSKAWDNAIVEPTGLNIRIDMRWIVQYKDTWPILHWPATISDQISYNITLPQDITYIK